MARVSWHCIVVAIAGWVNRQHPMSLRLLPGSYQVRLENPSGIGPDLDYFELIAQAAAAPAEKTLIVGKLVSLVLEEDGRPYVVPLRATAWPARLSPDGGFCYTTLASCYPGDGMKDVPPSTLHLFENGKELGRTHAPHVNIRGKGSGRFSRWNTTLYFSASDNSDPRTNGRKYMWQITPK